MEYIASRPFRGDPGKAFGLAESALTALGFRLTERTSDSLELLGPGMNSTKQSALVGASRIHLAANRSELSLKAELGGVAFMSRFVTYFPPGLCLFLAILLSLQFALRFGPGVWIYIVAAASLANTLLWVVLGPMIARDIRTRTCNGLDALLSNMVIVGEAT